MLGAHPAWQPLSLAVGFAALGYLTGCNGILGIHQPSDRLLDGAAPAEDDGDPGDGDPGSDAAPIQDGGNAATTAALWADWPMPNPKSTGLDNAQSYQVDKKGFVVDEITQLVWQDPVDGAVVRTWREADAYCEELTLQGGSFRLPNRIELLSLVDFTHADPSIDTGAFADAPSAYFWSSSKLAGNHSLAWLVNFGPGPGFVSSSDLSSTYAVRCVRRVAASARSGHFMVKGGTVAASGTKLTWQRQPPDEAFAWDKAAEYCDSLDLAGDGWRLPTIKELMTIVDETQTMPAIDGSAFPNASTDYVWTSSRVANSKGDNWAVSFRFGFDAAFADTTEQQVRCVRAGS